MSENWIEWNGGCCPVKRGSLVDVKHRDGDVYYGVPAGMPESRAEDWSHDTTFASPGDIVAYRVSKTPSSDS